MSRAKMIALPFLLSESLPFHKIFFIPGHFQCGGWGGGVGGAYNITAVHT